MTKKEISKKIKELRIQELQTIVEHYKSYKTELELDRKLSDINFNINYLKNLKEA